MTSPERTAAPGPIIVGRQVRLEPFTEADIGERYLGWLHDPEVVRFSNQRFRTHSLESSRQYLKSFAGSENLFLLIRDGGDGEAVGTITAYLAPHHGTADIGILVGERSRWGRGYGLDAWTALMHYLLNERGLRKVTGGTLRCNVGMLRIMERAGMELEAVRRHQELVDNQPQDALYFAKFADQ